MWFLMIVQIMLGYTVARCPRTTASLGLYCLKRWERCSYKSCYCYGKYQVTTSYYCTPWRRWRRVGAKRKCPPCPKDCGCTSKKVPVCATNGRTYTNKCQLSCQKKRIACNGKCPCKNTCKAKCRYSGTFLYCGTNGVTYRNSCSMWCAKAKYKCVGRCPCRRMRTWSRGRSYRRSRGMRSFRG